MMRTLAVMLLVALGAVACATEGGSSGDVSSGAGESSDAAGASNSAESSEADGADGTESESGTASTSSGGADESDEPSMAASSPIGAFFADDGGFEAALEEYRTKVEEQIVLCMAEQGFEFARTTSQVNPVEQRQNELSLREWTSEYGFGISTSFDSVAQNQASDPNAEIIFSLSESERELWFETLTGGNGLGNGDADTPLEEQGCIGASIIATGGEAAIEGIQTFGSAYEEGEEALFDRREMVEVIDAWARCMSESGFPGHSELDSPEESIGERFDEVIAPMDAALDELTPEEGQALISGESLDLADLPDLDLGALRELQADEITLAIADLDCYEAEVKATYEPLRDEFELGLPTEYSAEFEALRNIGG